MKKSEISVSNACLVILILALLTLTPMPSMAEIISQNTRAQATIQGIDIRAGEIAIELGAIRYKLRNLRTAGRDAEVWFSRLNGINAKIRDLEKEMGGIEFFDPIGSQDLRQLENERTEILKLNGGVTFNGQNYTSMDQLKNAYTNLNKEYTYLEENYEEYENEMETLGLKRKIASYELEKKEQEKIDLNWDKALLEILDGEMRDLEVIVNDNKMWASRSDDSKLNAWPSKRAVRWIRSQYIEEVKATPGKEFNKEELKQRFIKQRDESNRIKKEAYFELLGKIQALQLKINAEADNITDISGCWMIYLYDHDHPQVSISRNLTDGYSAYVTVVGVLDHIRQGHMLFEVTPVNKTEFHGFEYSTDFNGNPTSSKLRLIVNGQGDRMDYRSDDALTLARCD